jgi:membrane-associated protein
VLAARGQISIVALCFLVVVCAVAGDSVGFEVGRHFGDRVLRLRPLRRHEQRLDSARSFLRHRGAFAVFLGRWTAFLRAVMPGLAGLSRMHYPRFLFFNAVGGVAWGITYCLIGYLAGASYAQIERQVGAVGAIATVVVVLIGLLVWHRHRRRRGSGESDERPAPCANVGEQG